MSMGGMGFSAGAELTLDELQKLREENARMRTALEFVVKHHEESSVDGHLGTCSTFSNSVDECDCTLGVALKALRGGR